MRAVITALACALLAGCASTMGALDAPPAWCMAASAKPEPLQPGDDLVKRHADLKVAAARERSKTRCLQRYARAVSQ